ncbi:hypothetical protein [Microbacterium sp. SORGH_AS_0888]|uniref:hypothetical protein n=1 Tax=Microbacterium sp. SORGH_AS_0888 TaxID=3041791 RepID=UPI002789069D|nr:hypothetical protein [Microbacterium sp. SORGH_AS_0888]MDQ1130967.1 hypothetical protein [Microbacterium sp. SORGH_AS_0888]
MERIASIPFVRNILEYTKGTDDPDYMKLTSLLHWKQDSRSITNAELDRIFIDTFRGFENEAWGAPTEPVLDLLIEQADMAVQADEGVNFENKIVLSIATRLLSESYMVAEIADPPFTDSITGNQTQALFQRFKNRGLGTVESRNTLDGVVLMTPENIHVNSFMYEPIIDMSDAALRGLYAEVKRIRSASYAVVELRSLGAVPAVQEPRARHGGVEEHARRCCAHDARKHPCQLVHVRADHRHVRCCASGTLRGGQAH